MRSFTLTKWLFAAVFVAGLGTVTLAPAPGYADSSGDPCKGLTGKKKRQCEDNNNRADRELYYAGYWLARAGKYDEALSYLRQIKNKETPEVQNYIGYSIRKLGDVDGALVFYKKAIKLAPNYTLARAYMGEAYLQKGDKASAKAQLAEIGKRCGTGCQEYGSLAKQIAQAS